MSDKTMMAGRGAPDRDRGPLGLIPIALSLFGIAGAAILLCCVVAVIAILVLIARVGHEGASDFVDELRFDGPLKTRLGALVVSILYVGVATATLTAAIWRGRWAALLALGPMRRRGEAAIIGLATLLYAGVTTTAVERMRDHGLVVSGPTDVLLLSTIVANLVILAPIAEELLFRGWLYTGLRHRMPFWPSFLVTLALFAAIHGEQDPKRIVQVLPLAVALGLLRERTGSIRATIALHAVYNLLIVSIRLAFA